MPVLDTVSNPETLKRMLGGPIGKQLLKDLSTLRKKTKKRKITTSMRRFQLWRDEDETGVSGEGLVGEGIEFSSGAVAMTWLKHHRSWVCYESIKTVEEIHGHGGKTRVVFLD